MSSSLDERSPARELRVVFLPHWHDNPYQAALADALSALGVRVTIQPRRHLFFLAAVRPVRPHVVHLHAPDHFVIYGRSRAAAFPKLLLFAAQLLALRACGIRLVWTAHDLINHEGRHPRIDHWCRRLTALLAHAIVVHCQEAERLVATAMGLDRGHKFSVVPHGHYIDHYPNAATDRSASRASLGLPADRTVLLFLGNLREHKGLDDLVEAYHQLDRANTRLVIAGQPFTTDIANGLVSRIGSHRDIDFRPGFVPDADVHRYMQAADVVICPFRRSLTSGSVALAMSFGRACVAPRLGCMPEMLDADGAILYEPHDPGGLLGALRSAVDRRSSLDEMGRRNREKIEGQRWPVIAALTLAVYRDCLDRPSKR